jgi:hypothetical protein
MIVLKDSVSVACAYCLEVHTFGCSTSGVVAWQAGELIQNALPELSADQRELIISGTCGDCWDEMFPEDSED